MPINQVLPGSRVSVAFGQDDFDVTIIGMTISPSSIWTVPEQATRLDAVSTLENLLKSLHPDWLGRPLLDLATRILTSAHTYENLLANMQSLISMNFVVYSQQLTASDWFSLMILADLYDFPDIGAPLAPAFISTLTAID